MNGDTLHTIGELGVLTGLPVRTIRFWSDEGLVPPTDRTPAGYRLYDREARARPDLVRTLRDLGIDLATIQRLLARETTVADVAAVHAEALDAQIRTLRLRRAVLRAVAGRGAGPEELELMNKIARLSAQERRRLIEDFVDQAFEGLDVGPEFVAKLRSTLPELPEDATAEQTHAWVGLAELVQDEDFRAAMRRIADYQARERAEGARTGRPRTGLRLADRRPAGPGPVSPTSGRTTGPASR